MINRIRFALAIILYVGLFACSLPLRAQPPGGRGGPQVMSPEVGTDRKVTFKVRAPQAQSVRLSAGDIPGNGAGTVLTKGDNGVWEITLPAIDPGAYRYNFNIDGVSTIDPRNSAISESNTNVWSLVVVPGSPYFDTKNVPHGAVAAVTYWSSALSKFRRMHIYTPPGYEQGNSKYPVFYLLHGAGDNDDAWTSVGRAGFIMDNLIAEHKAKPMILVMPAGHTRSSGFGARPTPGQPAVDEFVEDFVKDVMPYVQSSYRTVSDRQHRAIAGLSMGGSQTLNIAIPHLDKFAYVGVFSSGLFGIVPQNRGTGTPAPAAGPFPWEQQHMSELDNAGVKSGLKLFWFGTGKDDFLVETSKASVELFKKHGFNAEYAESTGGHTWINWRNYLTEFAPRLFQ